MKMYGVWRANTYKMNENVEKSKLTHGASG